MEHPEPRCKKHRRLGTLNFSYQAGDSTLLLKRGKRWEVGEEEEREGEGPASPPPRNPFLLAAGFLVPSYRPPSGDA